MLKISDFKIPEAILRKISSMYGVPFLDLPVSCEMDGDIAKHGFISVKSCQHIGETYQLIVKDYVSHLNALQGESVLSEQSSDFAIKSAESIINKICFAGNSSPDSKHDKPTYLRLSRKVIPWLFMTDIVCPLFDVNPLNLRLASISSHLVDPAKLIANEKDIDGEKVIIVNMDIEDLPTRNAFICVEAIKGHDLNPSEVMRQMFDSDLFSKIDGFAGLAFPDEKEKESFIGSLILFAGLGGFLSKEGTLVDGKITKNSQVQFSHNGAYDLWWYLGIMEGMLEPTRGQNWETYLSLERYSKDFWNKVAKIKKERGSDKLTIENLLRLKSGYLKTPKNRTMQSLLQNNRVL